MPRERPRDTLRRMPQSLSLLLVHIIFSTKDRKPWLNDVIRPELHAYMASVAGTGENFCFRVGGVEDHVHVAVLLARNATVVKLVEALKVSSSKWIKIKGPEFASFRWQRGYAAFSVGPTDRQALLEYIDAQATHHRRRDYQAEMRALFTRYGGAFDEGFVWDGGGASAPITRAFSPHPRSHAYLGLRPRLLQRGPSARIHNLTITRPAPQALQHGPSARAYTPASISCPPI